MSAPDSILTPAAKKVFVAILILFALATSLKLHGFSFGLWHTIIDGSPQNELLLNENQPIRIDDWNSHLTLALAQRHHEPSFPLINRNIGAGQSALTHPMPAGWPLGLFRPATWGYFFSSDFGIAWNWNFQVLALFSAVFALLLLLTRGSTLPSVLGAAVVVTSPFFIYWSFNSAPVTTFTIVGVIAAYFVLYSRSLTSGIIAGAVLTWAGIAFGVCMYPPYQIPLAYLGLALMGFLIHRNRLEGVKIKRLPTRLGILIVAIAAIGVGGLYFMQLGSEMIQAMQNSVYPGSRRVSGGGYSLSSFFSNNFIPLRAVSDWSRLGNICEGSSFVFTSPWAALAWCALLLIKKPEPVDSPYSNGPKKIQSGIIWMGGLLAIALLWSTIGLPSWFEHLTLLDRVPLNRAAIALGIADISLTTWLIAQCSVLAKSPSRVLSRTKSLFVQVFFALLITAFAIYTASSHQLRTNWGTLRYVLALGAAQWLLFRLILRGSPWATAPVVFVQLLVNGTFTPLNRGGAEFFENNPLSQKIKEIGESAKKSGRPVYWAGYGDPLAANLIRALGSPVLNGFHLYPQTQLWSSLSASPSDAQVYNRLAHICMNFTEDRKSIRFELGSADAFCVAIHPTHTKLAEMGVTHLLYRNPVPSELWASNSEFTPVFQHGHYTILQRKAPISPTVSRSP